MNTFPGELQERIEQKNEITSTVVYDYVHLESTLLGTPIHLLIHANISMNV